MKSEKIRLYTIEIALVIFFLLAMIFNQIITKQILAVILLVFMAISVISIKSDKMNLANNEQIAILLGGMGIIYVAILYIIGIFAGFYNSTVKFSMWSILNYILPYIVIIVSTEIIRKRILLKENKYSKVIILIAMVILDIIISTNIYNLKTVNDYFVLVSFVIFASISNNLLFNHIVIKYRNKEAVIVYRLITNLYAYIFPITPDIYIFLESIIKMVFPYVIYIILEEAYSKKRNDIFFKEKKK